MKKIFSLLLVTMLLLSMSVTAFAADITTDGGSRNVPITYGVSQSFTVVIPGDINIDSSGEYETQVLAQDVMIPNEHVLNVSISSDTADGADWYLTDISENGNTINYKIDINGAGDFDVENESVILSLESGELECEVGLTFKIFGDITKAGTYKDILTFNVNVDSNYITFNVEGRTFNVKEGTTWAEFLNSSANTTFSCSGYQGDDEPHRISLMQTYGGYVVANFVISSCPYDAEFIGEEIPYIFDENTGDYVSSSDVIVDGAFYPVGGVA